MGFGQGGHPGITLNLFRWVVALAEQEKIKEVSDGFTDRAGTMNGTAWKETWPHLSTHSFTHSLLVHCSTRLHFALCELLLPLCSWLLSLGWTGNDFPRDRLADRATAIDLTWKTTQMKCSFRWYLNTKGNPVVEGSWLAMERWCCCCCFGRTPKEIRTTADWMEKLFFLTCVLVSVCVAEMPFWCCEIGSINLIDISRQVGPCRGTEHKVLCST